LQWLQSSWSGPKSAQFVVALRNPADWLWSYWRYFKDENDIESVDHWHTHRSAAYFEELVRSNGTLQNSILPRQLNLYMRLIDRYLKVRQVVGRDRFLAVQTEKLNDPSTLCQMAAFAGLDAGGFPEELLVRKANCLTSCDSQPQQTMFNSTREMINLDARPLCARLRVEFGVNYPECL